MSKTDKTDKIAEMSAPTDSIVDQKILAEEEIKKNAINEKNEIKEEKEDEIKEEEEDEDEESSSNEELSDVWTSPH